MKLIHTAIFFTLTATAVFAQKSFILQHQPKLGFIALSAGVSLPTGDFANRTVTSEGAGLAERGSVISISAGYRVLGVLGLMGQFQQQHNLMDASALLTLPLLNQADKRIATAGQWTITSTLGGPYVSLPVGRFSLDLRALAGPATASCPANRIDGWQGDIAMSLQTSTAQARSMAYGGGLTVSYRLGRFLATQVNADYTTARFTFAEMTTTLTDGVRSQRVVADGQKTISALNLSGGLTFLFGNRNRPF